MKKLLLALTACITAVAANAATGVDATVVNNITPLPVANVPIPQITLKTPGNEIAIVQIYQNLYTLVPANSKVDTLTISNGQKIQTIPLPEQCKVILEAGKVLSITGRLESNQNGQYSIADLDCSVR